MLETVLEQPEMKMPPSMLDIDLDRIELPGIGDRVIPMYCDLHPDPRFINRIGSIHSPFGDLGLPDMRDVHETFRYDRYGNLYDGHTTFDSTKEKYRINHEDSSFGKTKW